MAKSTQPRIIAAMPAYNEARYIGTMVLKARQYVDEVIVVDDGSTDNTAEVASLAGATVVRFEQNKGYGAAIQCILTEAKKQAPDVLVLLDADTQHNPDEIPNLIKPVLDDGVDFVIGSRALQANRIPFYRRIGQKVITHSAGVLSGKELSDTECGFRCFSKKAIATLKLKEDGMAVSAETIAEVAGKGLKVAEVPVSTIYTKNGSTLNPVAHGMGVLTRIIVMISERKPLFFFGLGGVILLILGLISGINVLQIFATTGVPPLGTALLSALLFIIGMFGIFTGIVLHVIAKSKISLTNHQL
ncbi:Undecaprenyl-phosphate 4-deoxy-4-formamido-L-arabinose transferase [subsurface metagenome]